LPIRQFFNRMYRMLHMFSLLVVSTVLQHTASDNLHDGMR